jgi:DNA/RNA-binding domain of Phe-tRNA-synthetase-like protein
MHEEFLARASVDPAVFALRPDYRALLLAVEGIEPAPADELVEAAERAPGADEHVAAWREAYRSFGAKPSRTRNSLEALLRRPELPRVNPLTDLYNAISVLHGIPVGGEDLTKYDGSPRLIRATGAEPFDTAAGVEFPAPGEVVWCDDAGVTCRRWNWRQSRRTALHEGTTSALFIFDALDPVDDTSLHAAADHLVAHLGPDARSARRLITAAG